MARNERAGRNFGKWRAVGDVWEGGWCGVAGSYGGRWADPGGGPESPEYLGGSDGCKKAVVYLHIYTKERTRTGGCVYARTRIAETSNEMRSHRGGLTTGVRLTTMAIN